MMRLLMWTAGSFLSGSLMFSYWLGLLAKHDLKEKGDGNPGALNLWRAAGYGYGLTGIALDFLKGYLPVLALLHWGGLTGCNLVYPAAAAVLGHMFSPFAGWRGGKAIAVTFGVWSALTGFEASLAYAVILALLLAGFRWIGKGKPSSASSDGFQVVLGMLLLLLFLFLCRYPVELAVFSGVNAVLLAYSHRKELRRYIFRMKTGHRSSQN
ncbi:glycerol-3-phosphate acyltransferase [Paenibacillus sp. D9]|uniref:glycerol-3-phosphate acyltransferase n=1 Tax=Paenibacillus sp. D9 TaxID=665792 RepID=UPI000AD08485|nr:glycerol-3-phosphate acyltransferase [Paenibacillus sp. D9]